MKKFHSFLALTLLVMATSCGDDKDAPVNIAAEVSGTYTGYTLASCSYFQGDLSVGQKVIVTESGNTGKVNISYTSESWGAVSVRDAIVAEEGTGYLVNGQGVWAMGMNGNTKQYDCVVTGRVTPSATMFIFSCPSVMGGLRVEFNEGEVPLSVGNE